MPSCYNCGAAVGHYKHCSRIKKIEPPLVYDDPIIPKKVPPPMSLYHSNGSGACTHCQHPYDAHRGATRWCPLELAPPVTTVGVGIGGAPTRASTLPTEAADRKKYPVGTGVLDYFPDALVAIANLSYQGNEQHNPGQPLHWARGKSTDEADTMIRHYLQRGTTDTDGQRHTAKMAWRALALLQKEIEGEIK